MADSYRKARVEHRCTASSWHPGCGRVIVKGERYLSFSRGGLSNFSVCAECAPEIAATTAAGHPLLTQLALVPALTDMPTTRAHALQLAERVRFFVRHNDAGMLGSNGIAPAVRSCLASARFHGFDWRTRSLDGPDDALIIPGRMRTTAAVMAEVA